MTIHAHADTFAEIERTVQDKIQGRMAALRQLAAKPALDEPIPQTRVVNGLEISDPDHAAHEELKAKRRVAYRHKSQIAKLHSDIDQYERDAAALREKLAAAGVEPLAILPRGAWDAIRFRYELFEFDFNKDGSVNALIPNFMPIALKVRTEFLRTSFLFAAASAICVGYAVAAGSMYSGFAGLMLLVAAIVSACRNWLQPKRLVSRFLHGKSRVDCLHALFPGNRTLPESNGTLHIRLPDPPESVVEKIKRLLGKQILFSVTAEPDAIEFVPSLREQFLEAAEAKIAKERERRAQLADPILHVNEGFAVAIVDQYGDFKMEATAVEDALTEETSLIHPKYQKWIGGKGTLGEQIARVEAVIEANEPAW